MPSHTKIRLARLLAVLPVTIAILCSFSSTAAAQERPVPRWEIYGGYSGFYPGGRVSGIVPGGLLPLSSQLETKPNGIGLTGTFNFNRWFGLSLDGSNHWGSGETTLAKRIDDTRFDTISLGPKFTFRSNHFAPFLEVLVGDHRLVPEAFHSIDKIGVMAGGGLDIPFSRHFALRLIRADYVMSSYRYGPANGPSTDIRGARAQAGLIYMFGGDNAPAPPVSAQCTAEPGDVMEGEPVTASVRTSNFNPDHTLTYAWSTTGGTINGEQTGATVTTTALAAGDYRVTAHVSDPKSKKNGEATCSSAFAVKARPMNPPTISCAASPSTVRPGASTTINSTAVSKDGRPLTYSYSATSGTIPGTEQTALLTTAANSRGMITVTCNTADDRRLMASNTTTVNVEEPPPPPPPPLEASKLNQIDFKKNSPRVDNAAKAILDDTALRMQRDSDSRVVLVGESESSETRPHKLTAQRARNTKAYLTNEKGIDPGRIDIRSGNERTMQTQIWLVPAGANYNTNGTDEVSAEAPTSPRR